MQLLWLLLLVLRMCLAVRRMHTQTAAGGFHVLVFYRRHMYISACHTPPRLMAAKSGAGNCVLLIGFVQVGRQSA